MRIVYTMTISPLAGAPVERRVLRSRTDQTVRQPRIQIGDGVKDQTPSELSETGTTAGTPKFGQRRHAHAQIRRCLRGTHILNVSHENLRKVSALKERYRSASLTRKLPVASWINPWTTTTFSGCRQNALRQLLTLPGVKGRPRFWRRLGSGQRREGQPRGSAMARFARASYFEAAASFFRGVEHD
jgi:hypothetical protein